MSGRARTSLSTRAKLALMRLQNQHLVGARFEDPVDVVRWFCAVQSQDFAGAKWAVAQRTCSADNVALDRAFHRGDILRTHLMRPTWHFVAPQDIRWILELTAPRVRSVMASYNRALELDETVFKRSGAIIRKSLRGGKHLMRSEISAALGRERISATGTRLAHILMHAELEALICSGAPRGKQFTYALLDERVPPAEKFSRDEALAKLALRYFESHGPATIHDFAWWSGLQMADVRMAMELVEEKLVHEVFDGVGYWLPPAVPVVRPRKPILHLLPNYDEHLVAYRNHGPSFDPESLGGKPIRQSALIGHIVVRGGFVVGGWRKTAKRNRIEIRTDLLADLTEREKMALQQCAADYGRFAGLPVTIDGT